MKKYFSLIKQADKLDNKIRRKINFELTQAGFDGNGRFESLGKGLGVIAEILGRNNLEITEIMSAQYFMADQGSKTFDLQRPALPTDVFSPGPSIDNSRILISWYKFSHDKWEMLSYLS